MRSRCSCAFRKIRTDIDQMIISPSRLYRGYTHFRRGTLIARMKRLLRDARYRRGRPWDVEVIPGTKLRLHPDSELAKAIAEGGFEVQEQTFIRSYLRDGDTFIDIGANIGFFTVIAAAAVG